MSTSFNYGNLLNELRKFQYNNLCKKVLKNTLIILYNKFINKQKFYVF